MMVKVGGRLAMMCVHPCTACMALAVPVIVFTTPLQVMWLVTDHQ